MLFPNKRNRVISPIKGERQCTTDTATHRELSSRVPLLATFEPKPSPRIPKTCDYNNKVHIALAMSVVVGVCIWIKVTV